MSKISIQKPYNINISGVTIDGNNDNEITWQVSGSIQVNYQVFIYKNIDNTLIYDSLKISSYSLKHNLPNGSLINGNEYKIQIQVWNDLGQTALSDFEIFQTSSTPTVIVDAIPIITAPSYNFTATYSQAEDMIIRYYYVYLYDSNKNLIGDSGLKTGFKLEYLFSDLQSERQYFIEFKATSEKGLIGTSGLIPFEVLYTQPQVNLKLVAENHENASVKLSWNVIQIIGKTDIEPIYIDNEKIDLLNNRVWFDEGFNVNKNFTLKIWLEKPKSREDLLIIKGENGQIGLQYWWLDNRFHLIKKINNGLTVSWVSNEVFGDKFFVFIQQINDDFNIVAEEI